VLVGVCCRTSLTRLNLSFNLIESAVGLPAGDDSRLASLDLRGNQVAELGPLSALRRLRHLRLGGTNVPNPACAEDGWRMSLFNAVTSLVGVDGTDCHGAEVLDDAGELENLLALLAPRPTARAASSPPRSARQMSPGTIDATSQQPPRPETTAAPNPGYTPQPRQSEHEHDRGSQPTPIMVATPRIDEALRSRRERTSSREVPTETARGGHQQRSSIPRPRPTAEARVRPLQGGPVTFSSEDDVSAGPDQATILGSMHGSPSSTDDALDDDSDGGPSQSRPGQTADFSTMSTEALAAMVDSSHSASPHRRGPKDSAWLPGDGPDAVDEMLGEELAAERDRRSRAEYTARLLIQKVGSPECRLPRHTHAHTHIVSSTSSTIVLIGTAITYTAGHIAGARARTGSREPAT
jgi:hypothetical protein